MNKLLKWSRWLYCVYAFLLFVAIMLLIFPFAALATVFGRIRGGNMVFSLCRIWADLWFPLIGISVQRVFESPHDKTRPFIFITNHTSLLDAAILPKAFRQPLRPLGKAELSKVPVFGFIYRNSIVSVDRDSRQNRARSIRILKSLLARRISVLVFPEGTYNDTGAPLKKFYKGAFRVAIETETPIKPVLFLDAHARLPGERIFSLNPGHCRVVFLPEIPVNNLVPAQAGELRDHVASVMREKLVQFHASWIRE
jgi:1-acyl-sn-glycerol-3-phosphate acyltransferase